MKMSNDELLEIIELHRKWQDDCTGGIRAILQEVDLRGAILTGVDLRGADLSGADLSEANLNEADLSYASLKNTYLVGANLIGASLRGADLSGANLSGADLSGVDLGRADLNGVLNVPFVPMACPDTGSFIGYKKAILSNKIDECIYCIVMLQIFKDSKRSSATSRKCRCDKAKVLNISSLNGITSYEEAYSIHDLDFKYKVGEVVSVPNFDENRFEECAPGIHFFINRQEAVDY